MKRLILALSAITILTLPGWGQITPGGQARASVDAHRREANNEARRHHHRRHRRHHRRHTGA